MTKTINKIPDNLICVIHNGDTYYTHYFDGYVHQLDNIQPLRLFFLTANTQQIERGNAYRMEAYFSKYPADSIVDLVKAKFRGNKSYENHDFSKDTYQECTFGELPEEVKRVFRKFETHDNFKVSEAVSFHIKNLR